MKLRYRYHSEHHAGLRDRYLHFVYFAIALPLLLFAWIEFDAHRKSWETTGDQSLRPVLAIVGSVIGAGLMIFQGIRASRATRGKADRYVRINDEHIVWNLTQVEGEQRVALADVDRVQRRSIRDLELTLKSGEKRALPIYLIAGDAQQEELLRVLRQSVSPNG